VEQPNGKNETGSMKNQSPRRYGENHMKGRERGPGTTEWEERPNIFSHLVENIQSAARFSALIWSRTIFQDIGTSLPLHPLLHLTSALSPSYISPLPFSILHTSALSSSPSYIRPLIFSTLP
jgi:hypothetical protein